MSFRDLKNAIQLARRVDDLEETFRKAESAILDYGAEIKRLRQEWEDHYDYTERAVGRWSKRDAVDKKKAIDAAEAGPNLEDLDQQIRDGVVTIGSYRSTG